MLKSPCMVCFITDAAPDEVTPEPEPQPEPAPQPETPDVTVPENTETTEPEV